MTPGRHFDPQGADVNRVARFAGHARPSLTLDEYLHEFEARQGDGVALALLLGKAYAGVL